MISKDHLENFLRLNNISVDASDDIIKAALVAARWKEPDIVIAITVLRGTGSELEATGDSGSRLFTTERISPAAISSLLGININLQRERLQQAAIKDNRERISSVLLILIATATALALAFVVGFILLYTAQAGPFYNPVEELSA
jgi:hypothetical protein